MRENVYNFKVASPAKKGLLKTYTLKKIHEIPQIKHLFSSDDLLAMKIVASVLPFKVNSYVIDELIDWNDPLNDPIFRLTFPQKEMLSDNHFSMIESSFVEDNPGPGTKDIVSKIRIALNPHPANQNNNIPLLNGQRLRGIQHKYNETLLFFPSSGQTCHAYCTFCFRWPQFIGKQNLRFASEDSQNLVHYLREHPEVNDVLFTGGDPMIMSAKNLAAYIDPLINANCPNLQSIRIGSKSLSYWPYRYLSDKDADDVLRLFERIVQKGYNLAFMAHFNHPRELSSPAVEKAIKRIQNTGAIIRTQSPILNHINNDAGVWIEMWNKQVKLGCVPYYMFVARNTGAQDYFAVTLENAWKIYRDAYRQVSGIARTVRGPSMSADPGKIQVLGVQEFNDTKYFILRFLQARENNKVGIPFLADFDSKAIWWDELKGIQASFDL